MSVFTTLYEAHITIGAHDITWREIIGNAFGLASAIGGMRRRIWTSGIQSNTARAGVSASDRSRKMTAQSPVMCVASVTGRSLRAHRDRRVQRVPTFQVEAGGHGQ